MILQKWLGARNGDNLARTPPHGTLNQNCQIICRRRVPEDVRADAHTSAHFEGAVHTFRVYPSLTHLRICYIRGLIERRWIEYSTWAPASTCRKPRARMHGIFHASTVPNEVSEDVVVSLFLKVFVCTMEDIRLQTMQAILSSRNKMREGTDTAPSDPRQRSSKIVSLSKRRPKAFYCI